MVKININPHDELALEDSGSDINSENVSSPNFENNTLVLRGIGLHKIQTINLFETEVIFNSDKYGAKLLVVEDSVLLVEVTIGCE